MQTFRPFQRRSGYCESTFYQKEGKTNIIFLCHDILDRLANGMFLQETDNARNFRNLRDISNFHARAKWTRPDLRHGAESCAELWIASQM